MTWYEDLDFDENPFSTNPKHHISSLVNLDEIFEEIVYRVNAGSMLFVVGKDGFGKSSLMMKAAQHFGGKGMVAYVDCEKLEKKLNITNVLQGKYGFWGRLTKKKPKNMILLLDNVNQLNKANNDRIKYYFDQSYIKSIVFAGTSFGRARFSDSLRDRIGDRKKTIPEFTEDDAIFMIRNRIGDNELLNDDLIVEIFKMSKKNPKVLLENCNKLAEHVVEKGRKRVQQFDLEEVLTNETVV